MGSPSVAPRCPACQLQLCKSRQQRPHALLTEVKSDESSHGRETYFSCQTCGATLVNTSDLRKPGWRQAPEIVRPARDESAAKEERAAMRLV